MANDIEYPRAGVWTIEDSKIDEFLALAKHYGLTEYFITPVQDIGISDNVLPKVELRYSNEQLRKYFEFTYAWAEALGVTWQGN